MDEQQYTFTADIQFKSGEKSFRPINCKSETLITLIITLIINYVTLVICCMCMQINLQHVFMLLLMSTTVVVDTKKREADTIPTDSVPTDAIPTICSQDDPSTSLARLAYVEIVEIGKKLEWAEALDASKARH